MSEPEPAPASIPHEFAVQAEAVCPPGDPLEHVGEVLPADHDAWEGVPDADADAGA